MLEDDADLPPEKSELDLIKDITGVAYIGGSDTTVAAVIAFFLAMLVYPDVQARAQAEIDRVVGKERLPELSDESSLPYVQAVVNECYRWLPVLPMGLSSIFSFLIALFTYFISRSRALNNPGRRI
jgi:cytochrome P450